MIEVTKQMKGRPHGVCHAMWFSKVFLECERKVKIDGEFPSK